MNNNEENKNMDTNRDKLFKNGRFLIYLGLACFTLFNIVWQIMKSWEWEMLIGKGFVGNSTLSGIFILIMTAGAVMCWAACKKKNDKRSDRYMLIIFITSAALLLVLCNWMFQSVILDITYSHNQADLPDGTKAELVWEQHKDYYSLNICRKHGLLAKKVFTAKTADQDITFYMNSDNKSYLADINEITDGTAFRNKRIFRMD